MINIYHLTNAAPLVLFGMFALWAAASRWHWFVRTAVVAAAILVILFIPAFPLVILLSVQTLLVVTGIVLWRRRRQRTAAVDPPEVERAPIRFQLSLETVLLVMVIVAVVTAVLSRAPTLEPVTLYEYTVNGTMAAVIGLICVWLVCGRARWQFRVIAAPFLVVLLGFTLVCLHWAGYITNYWFRVTGGDVWGYIEIARRDLLGATKYWSASIALGMAVLCTWLYVVRRAGWFDPLWEPTASNVTDTRRREVRLARFAALALFGAVSIFPLILFYKLLTPISIPTTPLPEPNGFDDLIAAGNMIGPTAAITLRGWDQMTLEGLRNAVESQHDAFARMELGLTRPIRHPYVFKDWPAENVRSLADLQDALFARMALARRTNNREANLADHFVLMRLAQAENSGAGTNCFGGWFSQYETDAYTGIWDERLNLNSEQCREFIAKLNVLDKDREPWHERVSTQRILEENKDFETHLRLILIDWSGQEFEKWGRVEEYFRITQLRMLMIKLALHAYLLEHKELPATLDELVPDYMPEQPIDPFGGSHFGYRRTGDKYVLYSFGPDEDDDRGAPLSVANHEHLGDITDASLFEPPFVQRAIGPPQ